MPSSEPEVKFCVRDTSALESRLRELGFHCDTPRTFERNTLYDTADRRLRSRREILRIREYGGRWVVPHKQTLPGDSPDAPHKQRIDTETGHCVVDETPSGLYAELEGPPAWIDSHLRRLAVAQPDVTTLSYGRLFEDWQQRTGSPAQNMSFAEIQQPLTPRQ